MSVILVPVGGLKGFVEGREQVEVNPGGTVEDLLDAAGIEPALVAVVLREEDELVSLDYRPRDGETLKLIAVMGGG